ncbi:hypothetical protein MNBD_IGNAVI01-378 [hydrothermal vent metagenome]|uniref:DUF4136 domain-containing protein n=1 Tax=hydrothermal vent metagenome TaxID=652676 RepID=A0A3B1C2P8_9ZZZZ
MKSIVKLFGLLLLISMIGCSSISVNTDYDPTIDFSKYKTYKWFEGKAPKDDELVKYPLVRKRVVIAVDKALAAKGFTKVKNGNADFVVIIHAGTKERMQLNTYNYGGYGYGRYGYGWGGYGGMSTTDVSYYDEATLIVDIADAKKKELVWRGTGTGIVRKPPADQAEAQENINNVIHQIMRDFPPQKKK